MKSLFIVVYLFVTGFMTGWAQTISMYPPEIIPVSPEAAAVQRYISYPVDYSTGIPDIRIPLFEVKVGDIVLPITLSYHSAGLKPKEPGGRVGCGWTLNAEPSVMRTIRGFADHASSFALPENQALTKQNAQDLIDGRLDGEPDAYSYTLNPGSGSFYRGTYVPHRHITFPRNNDKIELSGDLVTITNADGLVYHFGNGANAKEKTEFAKFGFQTTRWLCNRITSLRTSADITFSYKDGGAPNADYYYNMHDSKIIEQTRDKQYNLLSDTGEGMMYLLSSVESNGKRKIHKAFLSVGAKYSGRGTCVTRSKLDAIAFNGYKIQFYYKHYQGDSYITDMIVKDAEENLIRRIQFFTNRYNEGTALFKLDSLRILAPDCEMRTYRFDYYGKTEVPNHETRGIDHWGFYNGANSNTCGVPSIYTQLEFSNGYGTIYPQIKDTIKGADREPNAIYTKLGMLKEIIYPEGLITGLEYEGNSGAFLMYYRGNNYEDKAHYAHPVGGLRIAKITESAPNDYGQKQAVVVRTYKYGLNQDANAAPIMGGGVIKHIVTHRDYCFESQKKWLDTSGPHYVKTWQAMPISNITFNNGSAVFYTFVREDTEDKKTGNKMTSKYYYDMISHGYNDILEYDDYYNPTKIATGYWDLIGIQNNPDFSYLRIIRKDVNRPYDVYDAVNDFNNDWRRGHLAKVEHYRKDTLTSSVSYTYNATKIRGDVASEQVWVYKPYCMKDYVAYRTQEYNYWVYEWPNMTGDPQYPKNKIENSEYIIGSWRLDMFCWKALESETHKQYFYQNGALETITSVKNYQYDDYEYHTNPTVITNLHSNRTIKDTYAYHDAMVNTLLYHKRLENNSSVESEIEFEGERPKKIRYKTNNMSDFVDKVVYDRYDHYGNVAEISTLDGKHTCYIWSYGNQHPVAEIDNITYTGLLQALSKDAAWIKALGDKSQPSEQDMNLLNGLRNQLLTSQVSTFTYKPLLGVSSITGPSGFSTYYEYDKFGRLIKTFILENGQQKVLQTNSYHTRNSQVVTDMDPLINEFFIKDIVVIDPVTNIVMEREKDLLLLHGGKDYRFKVNTQDGSGSFKYEWDLYYGEESTYHSIATAVTYTNQVTLRPIQPPAPISPKIDRVKVKITDRVTNEQKEALTWFYVLKN